MYPSREIDATEAMEMGLVTDVVPEDELGGHVMEIATRLVEDQSELGPRLNERALTRALGVEAALENETLVRAIAMAESTDVDWSSDAGSVLDGGRVRHLASDTISGVPN